MNHLLPVPSRLNLSVSLLKFDDLDGFRRYVSYCVNDSDIKKFAASNVSVEVNGNRPILYCPSYTPKYLRSLSLDRSGQLVRPTNGACCLVKGITYVAESATLCNCGAALTRNSDKCFECLLWLPSVYHPDNFWTTSSDRFTPLGLTQQDVVDVRRCFRGH